MIKRELEPVNPYVEKRKRIQAMKWFDLLGNYDDIMRRHTVGTNLGWEVAEFRGEIERRLKIADSPLAKAQMVLDQAQEISEAPQGPTAEMMVELRARGKVWDMFTKGQRPNYHPLAPTCIKCGGNLVASPTVHCPKCTSTNFLIAAPQTTHCQECHEVVTFNGSYNQWFHADGTSTYPKCTRPKPAPQASAEQ